MRKIRILLVDDHTLFRQGIKTLISAESDLEAVGEASDGSEAIEKAGETRPDVVLLDINMRGLSSFEAARQIKKELHDTKVLFLTMYDDQDYVMEGIGVGANGFVLKDSPAADLVQAVREVSRGGSYFSPGVMSQLVDDFRSRGKPPKPTLTTRESEVLKMLAEGNSARQVARGLKVSVKTIDAHRSNLMEKLGIHNKAQLVQYAIQKRIIQVQNFDFDDGN